MGRVAELNAVYDEIHRHYGPTDPELVRRQTVRNVLGSQVLLLGQALGRDTQRLSGLPYCFPPPEAPTLSRGGRTLDAFLRLFGYAISPTGPGQYAYHSDLAHYFPGRKANGVGDMKPSAEELGRNRAWLEAELRLVEPRVVIPLGKQPAAVFLERYGGHTFERLTDIAGTAISCSVEGHAVDVVAVYHPSGAFQHPRSQVIYEQAAALIASTLKS